MLLKRNPGQLPPLHTNYDPNCFSWGKKKKGMLIDICTDWEASSFVWSWSLIVNVLSQVIRSERVVEMFSINVLRGFKMSDFSHRAFETLKGRFARALLAGWLLEVASPVINPITKYRNHENHFVSNLQPASSSVKNKALLHAVMRGGRWDSIDRERHRNVLLFG